MVNIDGKTKVVGLIGDPIEHTKSPLMHNKGYVEQGINFVYIPIPVKNDRLMDAIKGVRAMQFAGVNVTVPYKERVIPMLNDLSKEAKIIGAVNTIKVENDKLVGYNTDGPGFVKDASDKLDFDFFGSNMVVVGAGGAARAAAVSGLMSGARYLVVTDIDEVKGAKLANYIQGFFSDKEVKFVKSESDELYEEIAHCQLLVNATPVGMHPNLDATPLKRIDKIPSSVKYYDVIYNPVETKMMTLLKVKGNKCSNGLGMLAGQGAIGYEIFTGSEITIAKMSEYLNAK